MSGSVLSGLPQSDATLQATGMLSVPKVCKQMLSMWDFSSACIVTDLQLLRSVAVHVFMCAFAHELPSSQKK